VDPLAAIVLGGLAGLLVALALLARPVRGPARTGRGRAPGEAPEIGDDLDGLLDAVNARRRRRGEAELTEHGVRRAAR